MASNVGPLSNILDIIVDVSISSIPVGSVRLVACHVGSNEYIIKASKTSSVPDPLWFKDQGLAIRVASYQS